VADRCAVVTYVSEQSASAAVSATGDDAVHLNDRLHLSVGHTSVTPRRESQLHLSVGHTSVTPSRESQLHLSVGHTSVTPRRESQLHLSVGHTSVTPLRESHRRVGRFESMIFCQKNQVI